MKAEHCSGAHSILCRFHAIESHLSAPATRCPYFLETTAPPPQQASRCSHMSCLAQTSAREEQSSYAPITVEPATAFTKKGRLPAKKAI